MCAHIILIVLLIFRRDAALEDLAVKPITQFPVTLDDEVWTHVLMLDHFLTHRLFNDIVGLQKLCNLEAGCCL